MKFSIEWRGRITRDVGRDTIEADTATSAMKKWNNANGGIRKLTAISEIGA